MRLWSVFLLLLITSSSFAQKDLNLVFHLDKSTIKKKTKQDSSGYQNLKKEVFTLFQLDGYVGISIKDSLVKGSNLHYYLESQHRFKRIELNCVNARKRDMDHDKNIRSMANTLDERITSLENKGFPFSTLRIVKQEEKDDRMYIDYVLDSGEYVYLDKIHIKSESKIHEKTVLNLINIKVSDAYNERKIKDIREIITNSPYFKLMRDPEVLFRKGKAELFLYLEKRRSSNADGFIGFNQDQNSGRLVFNGNVNLSLKNALNRAESLDLSWKSNPDKTQNFRSALRYPFLFSSPIGLGARINLQKQDTSFVKSDIWLEIQYIHPKFTFTIFDQIESSTLINNASVDGFRNYKKNTIGASVQYRPFMPEKLNWYHPYFELTAGIFNYREDTLDDNRQKIENNKYGGAYGHKIDFFKFFHLNNRLSYEGLSSSIDLSRNELIFYGGLYSVRGFYELELFGNDVWILNNEIEFAPTKSLSFKALYDYSISEYQGRNYTHSFGFGFGLTGVNSRLDIIIANGVLNDNPVDFSDSRIHIGFKSNF